MLLSFERKQCHFLYWYKISLVSLIKLVMITGNQKMLGDSFVSFTSFDSKLSDHMN